MIIPAVICPEEFWISKFPTTVLNQATVRSFMVAMPTNFASEKTCIEVPEEPTAPTVKLTSDSGLVVPIPTFNALTGEIPVPIPEGTVLNKESF